MMNSNSENLSLSIEMEVKPLATILLPVYNAERFIQEAIESILIQDYSDFCFLIINDGSTDNSEEIILSFNNSRITYIKNETNKGLVYTLNKGIDLIQTKYLIRMDADDISHPTRVGKLIRFMENSPEIGVCGSYIRTFDKDNSLWKYATEHAEILPRLLFTGLVPHAASIIRMKILNENKIRYRSDNPHMEDLDLWSRIHAFSNFANIPEELYFYRIYGLNITLINKSTLIDRKVNYFEKLYQKLELTLSRDEIKIFVGLGNGIPFTPKNYYKYHKIIQYFLKWNKSTTRFEHKYLEKMLDQLQNRVAHQFLQNHGIAGFLALVLIHKSISFSKLRYLSAMIYNKKFGYDS